MKEIPMVCGLVVVVDDDDYGTAMDSGPWHARRHGLTTYAIRMLPKPDGGRRRLHIHTLLTGWKLVDHKNGNGLDNRRANLRPATYAQNAANRQIGRNNTSGYKGVMSSRRMRKPWIVQIRVNRQKITIGSFASLEEAARAYDRAAIEAFGEYANLNFPDEHAEIA